MTSDNNGAEARAETTIVTENLFEESFIPTFISVSQYPSIWIMN